MRLARPSVSPLTQSGYKVQQGKTEAFITWSAFKLYFMLVMA